MRLSKRQKFVIATLILLAGIILLRFGPGAYLQWRFRVILFTISGIIVTIWALYDSDFGGIEWLTLPILPVFFAISSALVFPLLPSQFETVFTIPVTADTSFLLSLIIKFLFLGFFSIGFYASLLVGNIYNVSAVRTIQLLRVASSVGFLMTIATALLLYLVIFSFHFGSFLNLTLVFSASFFLALQSIWSVGLPPSLTKTVYNYSLLVAALLGQLAWVISFWPLPISIYALFLTAIFYELMGIIQYYLGERLNPKVAYEFVAVAIIIFFITVFTAQWGA